MSRHLMSLVLMRSFLLFGLLALPLAAAPRHFESGANRVHLLELFTSEGCSSCPPAEAWVGNLRIAPGLWRDFVPVAFHVAYWDRLGWRDRFATKEFTARQYAYSSRWGGDTVYTPGFVLDGNEWRRENEAPVASAEKADVLSVDCEDGACRVQFAGRGDLEVHVALLGGEIASAVHGGENNGRTLRHDFVALSLQSAPLENGVARLVIPASSDHSVPRHALAVWVTRRRGMLPLQATGGWLD